MKAVQAVWPRYPIPHSVSAAELSSDGQILWTGSTKGPIVQWERNPIGELYPVLCLCYYTEAISNLFWFPDGDDFNLKGIVMAMALENSKGTLFCCDVKGCMSCWDVASGICIATKRHFMGLNLPFGSLRRHGNEEVIFPVQMETSKGMEFEIAVIDALSMEIDHILKSPLRIPFSKQRSSEKSPRVLDIVGRTMDLEISSKDFLGISSDGYLLIWQSERRNSLEQWKSVLMPSKKALDIPTGWTSATFYLSQKLLLLTCSDSWFLLRFELTHGIEGFPCNFRLYASNLPPIPSLSRPSTSKHQPKTEMDMENILRGDISGGSLLHLRKTPNTVDANSLSDVVLLLWTKDGSLQLLCVQKNGRSTISSHIQMHAELETVHLASNNWLIVIQNETRTHSEADSQLVLFQIQNQTENAPMVFHRVAAGRLRDVWFPSNPPSTDEELSIKTDAKFKSLHVTCHHLVSCISSHPYVLVEGLSNGDLNYFELASYGLPTHPSSETNLPRLAVSRGHTSPILICKEVLFEIKNSDDDGTSPGPSVESRPILVTGTEDGSVGFWDLDKDRLGNCLFIVHPHSDRVRQLICPPMDSTRLWSCCMITVGDDGVISVISLEEKNIVRILSGNPFNTQLELRWDGKRGFLACLTHPTAPPQMLSVWDLYHSHRDRVLIGSMATEMIKIFEEGMKTSASGTSTSYPRVRAVQTPNDVFLHSSEPFGISWLEMNITDLLKLPEDNERIMFRKDDAASLTFRIATCLSVLHVWGIDFKTDIAVSKMIEEITKLDNISVQTPQSSKWTQGAIQGVENSITIEFPMHQISPSKRIDIGHLWKSNSEFVANRLVFIVALSKQLMHEGLNEVVCSACSLIATMYAIEFSQCVPNCCRPSLDHIVDLWHSSIAVVKETSRVLLASVTDLEVVMKEIHEGNTNDQFGTERIRKILQLKMQASLEREDLIQYRQDILAVGAICCVHSRWVSQDLLITIVSLLASVVTNSQTFDKAAITAAYILEEALAGVEGKAWLDVFQDRNRFAHQILDTCDRLESPNFFQDLEEISLSKASKTVSEFNMIEVSDKSDPASEPVQGAFKMVMKYPSRSFGNLRVLAKNKATTATTPSPRSESTSSFQFTPRIQYVSPMLVPGREALAALVTAICHLDLPLILKTLKSKQPSKASSPFSIVATLQATEALLHRQDGIQIVAQELSSVTATFMKSLELTNSSARKRAMAPTLMLFNHLNHKFPMLEIHQESHILAVGVPCISQEASSSSVAQSRGNEEVIAIYNLHSGHKKQSLCLGNVFHQLANSMQTLPKFCIGALSVRKDGDVIAALCPDVSALCIWDLRTSWQKKLSKSISSLEPIKILQIQNKIEMNPDRSQADLSFRLSWQLASQIAILHGQQQLDSIELHIGN